MKWPPEWLTVPRFLLVSATALGIFIVLIADPGSGGLTFVIVAFFIVAAVLFGWLVVAWDK